MNESGLHMSEFIWNYLIALQYCIFPLFSVICQICVFKFCCKRGSQVSTAKLPMNFMLQKFQGFSEVDCSRQPLGQLQTGTCSLSVPVIALCSLLFKSHRNIRQFSVLCLQSFPLTPLLKDVVISHLAFVTMELQLLPHSLCAWRTAGSPKCTGIWKVRTPYFYSCCTSGHAQNFLFLSLLYSEFALTSPSDYQIQFCKGSSVCQLWIIMKYCFMLFLIKKQTLELCYGSTLLTKACLFKNLLQNLCPRSEGHLTDSRTPVLNL